MYADDQQDDLVRALVAVTGWLDPPEQVGSRIDSLERALDGTTSSGAAVIVEDHLVSPELLSAAMFVRARLGKISDLIHAAAISLALPLILQPGETLMRPSLAAGNDPGRPFDVQSDQRAAEFKLARWQPSANGGREKELFKDVVLLSAAPPHLSAEVYVLGPQPAKWLTSSRSAAFSQLKGRGAMAEARQIIEQCGEPPDVPVRDFVSRYAAHVKVVDLEQFLPDLFA